MELIDRKLKKGDNVLLRMRGQGYKSRKVVEIYGNILKVIDLDTKVDDPESIFGHQKFKEESYPIDELDLLIKYKINDDEPEDDADPFD